MTELRGGERREDGDGDGDGGGGRGKRSRPSRATGVPHSSCMCQFCGTALPPPRLQALGTFLAAAPAIMHVASSPLEDRLQLKAYNEES